MVSPNAMKKKAAEFGNSDKTPMGECPLCYTENPYTTSRCVECNLPLPWAKAEAHEREPSGQCLRCQSENAYTTLNCWSCGARLPWANAVSVASAQVAAKATTSHLALPAPSTNGYGHPPATAAVPVVARVSSHSFDRPNQVVDVVSLLCPPLGFVAYVTLLGQLPRAAASAIRYALFGVGIWMFLLMFFFIGPHVKLGRRKLPSAPAQTAAANSSDPTAGEIYQ